MFTSVRVREPLSGLAKLDSKLISKGFVCLWKRLETSYGERRRKSGLNTKGRDNGDSEDGRD